MEPWHYAPCAGLRKNRAISAWRRNGPVSAGPFRHGRGLGRALPPRKGCLARFAGPGFSLAPLASGSLARRPWQARKGLPSVLEIAIGLRSTVSPQRITAAMTKHASRLTVSMDTISESTNVRACTTASSKSLSVWQSSSHPVMYASTGTVAGQASTIAPPSSSWKWTGHGKTLRSSLRANIP